jgi:hypothetical protein
VAIDWTAFGRGEPLARGLQIKRTVARGRWRRRMGIGSARQVPRLISDGYLSLESSEAGAAFAISATLT